jgi:hypothetical protein
MARRAHQRRVEALLESIEERRGHLELLRAAGVQPAGLRDLHGEIEATRSRLRETVGRVAARDYVRRAVHVNVLPGQILESDNTPDAVAPRTVASKPGSSTWPEGSSLAVAPLWNVPAA